jgi:hypothetical protein
MTKFLKEPLLHFLLLGGALFFLYQIIDRPDNEERSDNLSQEEDAPRTQSKDILVTSGLIDSLVAQFDKLWKRQPTAQEKAGLIDAYVLDEIMYREALTLGLDRDDPIVRRRMRQKLEFFTADIAALAEPTTKDLTDYLKAHSESYQLDSTFTFKQVYIDTKKRGASAESDLQTLLETLRSKGTGADISEAGDRLMIKQNYHATSQRDVERMFGRTFAEGLLKVPTGEWQGPVQSGYGSHIVLVSERIAGALPSFENLRETVTRDWTEQKREESNAALYQEWRGRYTVTVEEGESK